MKTTLLLGLVLLSQISFSQTWKKYNDSNSGLPTNTVYSMDLDTSSNTLWIGGSHYLVTFQNDSIWDTITTVIPNNSWYAVKYDSNGDVWVGGDDNCRLYHFSGSSVVEFTDSINSSGDIKAIEEDAFGNIWVGTTFGLKMYNGSRWFDYSDSILNEGIWAIELGFDSLMWFGSWAEELFSYDGQKFTNYTYRNSNIPNSQVRSIARGVYPNMWVGTRAGVLKFDGDTTWNLWTDANSQLADNEVYGIAVDNDTVAWLAMNGGSELGKIDSTGYKSGITYPFSSISFGYCIVINPEGRKYIGGQGGLVTYDNGGSGPVQAPAKPSSSTSIVELKSVETLIYPNPSIGQITIASLPGNASIQVFDLSGKMLYNENVDSGSVQIELPEEKGSYLLMINSSQGSSVQKVIRL